MPIGVERELREQTDHGELVLRLRAEPEPAASLMLEGTLLMDAASGASERALADWGLAQWREARGAGRGGAGSAAARVLLGGLGLGLTLRRLLEAPDVAFVQVVEIFPTLVEWNRGPLVRLNGGALADPRVAVRTADLLDVLAEPAEPYDLILLDIDNGPTFPSLVSNARLYEESGLELLRDRLAAHGVAAVWASEPCPDLEARLAASTWAEWRREEVIWRLTRGNRELTDFLYGLIAR